MIRGLWILGLSSLLMLVLYLPSAYPPQRFLAQVRQDHAQADTLWGPEVAARLLDRALDTQDTTRQLTQTPDARSLAPLATEVQHMHQRLFANNYFQGIDSLLMLATFRVAAMSHWSACSAMFIVLLLCDGAIRRSVRAKQFEAHEPERFALYLLLASAALLLTLIAMVLPLTWHPMLWPSVPPLVGVLLSRAWVNFPRSG